jgi:outer membrane protein
MKYNQMVMTKMNVEREMRKNPVYATIALILSMLLTLGMPVGLAAQNVSAAPSQAAQTSQQQQKQKPAATQQAKSAPPLTISAGPEFMKDVPWFPRSISAYSQQTVPEPVLTNSPTIHQLIRKGKLDLSMQDAIRLAIENNLNIDVQRYVTWITDTNVLRAKAGALTHFDPTVNSTLGWQRASIPINNPFISGTGTALLTALTQYNTQANFGYTQGFKTGTTVNLTFNNNRASSTSPAQFFNPSVDSTLSFGFQQQLLNGFGILPNTRYIIEAKLNSQAARYNLSNEVMNVVASVETAYWNLAYAIENVRVQQTTVDWAKKNLVDTQRQLQIGTLAKLDVVSAESELATNQQALIVAQTQEQQAQTVLLNLITRNPMAAGLENVMVVPTDNINTPPKVDIIPYRDAVQQAWTDRPDLQAQKLGVKVDDVEIKATRNALLPSLTLSGQYSSQGLAGNELLTAETPTSFGPNLNQPILDANGNPVLVNGQPVYVGTPTSVSVQQTRIFTGLTDAWHTVINNNFPAYGFSLSLSLPLRNRAAKAANAQAQLTQREAMVQVQALKNTISSEVRNAQIAMQQGLARVQATVKATQLARETLDAEQKKFQLGVSTDYQVILRQRDLATAEGNEIQAKATLLEAIVTFNKAIGRTLQAHNISVADAAKGHVTPRPLIPGTPIKSLFQPLFSVGRR